MKFLLAFPGLLLSISQGYAQGSSSVTVPQVVLDQFVLQYPEARQVKWTRQDGLFAATCRNQKHKTVVTFDPAGVLKRIEADIRISALPTRAAAYLAEEVNARRILQATLIAPDQGEIFFAADVPDEGEFVFDSDGDLIARKDRR